MEDWEIPALVRNIVRQELAPILMGKVSSTTGEYRAEFQRFAKESKIPNARLIQPYGIASRPKPEMDSLVAPVANDATHLNILGQFDAARPSLEEGEVALYGPDGQVVKMLNGGNIHAQTEADYIAEVLGNIKLGSPDADEPAVLGNVLKEMLELLLDYFTTEAPAPKIGIDSFGLSVYLDPQIVAKLVQMKLKYLTQPATNIVAQRIFVERGD